MLENINFDDFVALHLPFYLVKFLNKVENQMRSYVLISVERKIEVFTFLHHDQDDEGRYEGIEADIVYL